MPRRWMFYRVHHTNRFQMVHHTYSNLLSDTDVISISMMSVNTDGAEQVAIAPLTRNAYKLATFCCALPTQNDAQSIIRAKSQVTFTAPRQRQ